MPEGHITHRLAREHRKLVQGRAVRACSPQGRFVAGAERIDGRTLTATEALGKHLFHRFDADVWLHTHLGIYGRWTAGLGPAPEPRGQLRLQLWTAPDSTDSEPVWLELRGPAACELLEPPEVERIRNRLGPDPLRRDADPAKAWARISRSRTPIAALLMDQSVLAGVGNIFRAEVLFRHGVDPHRPGKDLDEQTWLAMWADLVQLMRAALRAGRIVTTDPADRPRRWKHPDDAYYVYKRTGEPCRHCGTPVLADILVARNLFWCPGCQRHNHLSGAEGELVGGVSGGEVVGGVGVADP